MENILLNAFLNKDQRLDGRSLTQIRDLKTEVALLPRTHGSGMFTRRHASTVGGHLRRLGTDKLWIPWKKTALSAICIITAIPRILMARPALRGPGKRAIGHGALAERPGTGSADGRDFSVRYPRSVRSLKGW